MFYKFSEDEKTFAIFFDNKEFILASKLLSHLVLDDERSAEITFEAQDKLEALQFKAPVLQLVPANPHCKFCGDSLNSKGYMSLFDHKWFCCAEKYLEVQDVQADDDLPEV